MDVGMIEPDPAELHQVFRLQPDREPAVIQRLVAEIADPQAGDADAVLVGIERADRLAERLADAVAAVGARRHVGADAVMPRIEADRVVRRGEHDALDALLARGLEQIVAADDIGLQDVVPRAFDRKSAEMQDAVDALADRFDLGEIGEVGGLEFFARAEIGGRFHVAQHQIRIDRRQQFAQARADFTGSAGHQYAWHFIPRFLRIRFAVRLTAQVIANRNPEGNATTRTANVRCHPTAPAGSRRRIIPIPRSTRSIRASRNTG